MSSEERLDPVEEIKRLRIQLFTVTRRRDALMEEVAALKKEVIHMRAKLKRLAKGHGS